MSNRNIQYVALVDWMWLCEKWMVRRIVVAPVYKSEDTLVITMKKESWGLFTFKEVQKNANVLPLSGFVEEPVSGGNIEWTCNIWPLSSEANFITLF
ncbi:hypothetical protein AVEN_71124-1 [Araneus ventricosus]|uniref:Uncharacterized protein n=1 Tax=Araneus ventricosus TaxID=182803 RepID=A0A4Y2HJC4_ARAVE|nr:hypothetical protein AVEN_71124-1 [Araneus ventricosus]